MDEQQVQNQAFGQSAVHSVQESSSSWVVALLLAFFLGGIGAHRFYLGKTATGIVMLVLTILSPFTLFITLIIVALWALVDFILILIGSMKDPNGLPLKK